MTVPAVLFPDAAALLIGYLRDQLTDRGDSTAVGQKTPNPRPDQFVTIHRVGGPRRSVVADAPLLAVECWATNDPDAHDLAQLARALLHTARGRSIDGVAVYRIAEAAGPVNLPDPLSQQSRYTFTLEVALRGAALADP